VAERLSGPPQGIAEPGSGEGLQPDKVNISIAAAPALRMRLITIHSSISSLKIAFHYHLLFLHPDSCAATAAHHRAYATASIRGALRDHVLSLTGREPRLYQAGFCSVNFGLETVLLRLFFKPQHYPLIAM
jgi:hypothetical protein